MSSDYAREKFWQAVHSLATGSEDIRERLAGAALFLSRLRPDDLPEVLRQEFEDVLHELTKEKALGDEGTIVATTHDLTQEEGAKLAERIPDIYTELHGGI